MLGHRQVSRTMLSEQAHWKFYHTLNNRFPQWWERWLGMARVDNLRTSYDKIVVGSDEVFNCTQRSDWGASMKWFGEGLDTRTLISYAASFGFTTQERLRAAGLEEKVSGCLKNFRALSVRDENSKKILEGMGAAAENHLDPVLVYDYERMVKPQRSLQDTIIIYTYPDRLQEQDVIEAVQALAQREKLRIVSIGSFYPWCENLILTPFEVLQHFYNAKYVVTDTFHGTVFSLRFQRPFATLVRDSNRQKLEDLLDRMGQQEAAIAKGSELDRVLHRQIPREQIREKLRLEQARTMDYLKRNLCDD